QPDLIIGSWCGKKFRPDLPIVKNLEITDLASDVSGRRLHRRSTFEQALLKRWTDRNVAGLRHVCLTPNHLRRSEVVKRTIASCAAFLGLILGLSACTNPYDPAQRFVGGGLLGAGAGAAIGAAAGGGPGAALGAAIGGATGIFGGVASTPPPPPGTYYGYPAYGYPAYPSPMYGYPGYAQPGYGYPGYSGYPAYSSSSA